MTNCCYNCTIINPKHFIMRKLIFAFLMLPCLTMAQSLIGGNNIIKANLSSLAFGNYHVTYERSIAKKLSLSVSYRFMPKTGIPYASQLQDMIKLDNVKVAGITMANTAITPELRIYLGTGKMKGFYIAPYARFASFDLAVPISYDAGSGIKKDVTFEGTIKSTSAGLMIGMQKQIAKKLVLDIWFIGGHYGSGSGTINATINPPLANAPFDERAALQTELNKLKDAGGPFKFEGTVTSNTNAVIKSDGPWAGVRGAMISLGFRF